MKEVNIEEKYKEIRKDIMDNIEEVFLRSKYYSRKYRGDEWNDINVSIDDESPTVNTIQIFLRNKSGYIKEVITMMDNKPDSVLHTDLQYNVNG